jgi:hypothetical protein
MNSIFKKSSGKNLKIYIINTCVKTPETLWEKQKKATTYNVIIVPMKKTCRKKIKKQTLSYIGIASLKPIVRKLFKAKLT